MALSVILCLRFPLSPFLLNNHLELRQKSRLALLEGRSLHSNLDATFARIEARRRDTQDSHSPHHHSGLYSEEDIESGSPTRPSSTEMQRRVKRSSTRNCDATSRSEPLIRLERGVEEQSGNGFSTWNVGCPHCYKKRHTIHEMSYI